MSSRFFKTLGCLLSVTQILAPDAVAQERTEMLGVPRTDAAAVSVSRELDAPSNVPESIWGNRVGIEGEIKLRLDEVISEVLTNNNRIETSWIDREIAGFDAAAAEGFYDPELSLDSLWEEQSTPVTSIIGGAESGRLTQSHWSSGQRLTGESPWLGGAYGVELSFGRLTSDNDFITLNPQYPTDLTFSYVQPLGRGLSTDLGRRNLEVRKKNESLTDEQFRKEVIDTLTLTTQAYWELVFAARNMAIQIDAAESARQQVESNRRIVAEGILAPIAIVEAETQLHTFEENVYIAQGAVTRAENALKALMLPDRSAHLWSLALVPATPVDVSAPDIGLEAALTEAMERRPELAQIVISGEINDVDTRYFREETKPVVDLVASYALAGLAGEAVPSGPNPITGGLDALVTRTNELSVLAGLAPLPPLSSGGGGGVPEKLVGGYEQSFSNLFGRNFPTASIGVRFSFPLRNRTAEGNLAASRAEGRRIQTERDQMEQIVEAEVRSALQSVESGRARLASASAARQTSEEQYESEQRQFRAGTSTVFLVLQRQTTMITARSRELRAQIVLAQDIAELHRAIADTLDVHDVTIEAARK